MSAKSWVAVYLGLILNMVGVVPLLASTKGVGWAVGEAVSKYFLVQAVGTLVFTFGGFLSTCALVPGKGGYLGGLLLTVGLLIKLGMWPFHVWVPGVLMGLSWGGCWVLMTWQKVVVYVVIVSVISQWGCESHIQMFLVWSVMGTCVVGAVGGLGQTNIRSLLAYSSMLHSGWGLMGAMCGGMTLGFYLVTYIVAVTTLILLFSKADVRGVQSLALKHSGVGEVVPLALGVLVLQGMPPFIVFFGKWVVLSSWVGNGFSMVPVVVILGSTALGLYYYLSVVYGLFWRSVVAGSLKLAPKKGVVGGGLLWGLMLVSIVAGVIMFSAFGG
uniref:NADH dehydrogenase subunit 2 n=1 Tax=Patelloida saccharinoides TaxID=225156 RepID=UPI0023D831E0|nr:NADH dehydrogenase subunit 2 [Patelloida saccharinoides]WCR50860.1 NADH dehydrogenase subunit 2 [Patelloida saccharinoides]